MKHLNIVLDYIIEHEREDFLVQCGEAGITEEQGLSFIDHVYAHARKGEIELESVWEKITKLLREMES